MKLLNLLIFVLLIGSAFAQEHTANYFGFQRFHSVCEDDSLDGFSFDHAYRHIKNKTSDVAEQDRLLMKAKLKYDSLLSIQAGNLPTIPAIAQRDATLMQTRSFDCSAENWDFENGTLSGWTSTGDVSVVNGGVDVYGGYPQVYPGGGAFSVKLEDDANDGIATLERTLAVPATGTTYFSFHFAMSIFNFPHQAFQAAKFYVKFFDQNGNQIGCPYFEAFYSTDQGAQGVSNFQQTPNNADSYNPGQNGDGNHPVTFSDWSDVTLDLSGYSGQTITVQFIADWCIYNADWCYAYIDVDCPISNSAPVERCETLPYNLSGPNNMATYEWTDINGTVIGNNQDVLITQEGTYYCEVLPSNIDCSVGSLVTYEYSILQTPDVAFGATEFCRDSVVFDNNSVCSPNATCTYAWDFDDAIGTSTLENPVYTYALPGIYNVDLEVTSTNGCVAEESVDIIVQELPVADFTFNDVCLNTITTFTDQSTPGTASITNWDWDFTSNGIINNTTQNPTSAYTSDDDYTVNLEVTNDQGCKNDISKVVTVYPLPQVGFTQTDVCDGDPMTFTDTTIINSGNIVDWLWDLGDAAGSSVTQNTTYQYTAPGTYNVQLTVTSDNGCLGNAIIPAGVYNNPTADFTYLDVCDQVSVSMTNTSLANGGVIATTDWDFTNDGTIDFTGTDAAHTYSIPGTYTISQTVTSSNGCVSDVTHDVTVHPNPVINISGDNICETFTSNFVNTSSVATGAINTHFWDFANGNTSNAAAPTEVFANEGVYQVQLTETSDQNCATTGTTTIEVYPTPQPLFITSNVCDGTQLSFTDFSSVSNSNTTNTITNWNWDFGDTPAGTATGAMVNYLYAQAGTYNVTLDLVTNNGCINSVQQPVTVHPNPVVSFTSPNPDGCTEWCPDFTNTSTITSGTIASYLWTFGNGEASINTDPSTCYQNNSLVNQTFDITLTANSDMGCQTTLVENAFVTVYPEPVADFEPSRYVTNIYQTEIEFTNQSLIGDTYLWDFGDSETSTEENPIHTFSDLDSGTYEICLQTTTIHGCVHDTCKTVVVVGSSNVYVPNAFSPDGDGVNDFFSPSLFGVTDEGYTFMIFDRWGLLIYQSNSTTNTTWDGTYKGEPVQFDAYIWKLNAVSKYDGKAVEQTGHVTLIK